MTEHGAGRSRNPLASTRFAVVGLAATAVDYGGTLLLVSAGVGRLVADLVALVVAAVIGYRLHTSLTLRGDELDRWIRQPPVFFTAAAVAGVVDAIVFVALADVAVAGAKAIAVGAGFVVRAVLHRAVLFRSVRRGQTQAAHRAAVPDGPRLSVVIPAFNEADRIAATVSRVRRELGELDDAGDLEIVVVDDGSGDATADVARSCADVVVEQPQNRGKGAAVRAGVERSSGRTVAFTDADLAYPPAQLVRFVEAIESGYDVAIGNRHHELTSKGRGTSAVRSFGSRVVNMATTLLLLGNYRDTQCGCKAFRRDVAGVVFGAGTIDGFAFDIEVLHLVERYGLSMVELPVDVVNSETSTVRALRDGVAVLVDIIRVRRAGRRGRYPTLGPNGLPNATLDPTPGEVP